MSTKVNDTEKSNSALEEQQDLPQSLSKKDQESSDPSELKEEVSSKTDTSSQEVDNKVTEEKPEEKTNDNLEQSEVVQLNDSIEIDQVRVETAPNTSLETGQQDTQETAESEQSKSSTVEDIESKKLISEETEAKEASDQVSSSENTKAVLQTIDLPDPTSDSDNMTKKSSDLVPSGLQEQDSHLPPQADRTVQSASSSPKGKVNGKPRSGSSTEEIKQANGNPKRRGFFSRLISKLSSRRLKSSVVIDDGEDVQPSYLEEISTAEGNELTLHGKLDVEIVRAEHLINRDGVHQCCVLPCFGRNSCKCLGVSDPFVEVVVGDSTILRSTVKHNTLNPIWKQVYTVQLCHSANFITFRVRDKDIIASDFLGEFSLKSADLVREASGASGLQGTFPLLPSGSDPVPLQGVAGAWAEGEETDPLEAVAHLDPLGSLTVKIRFTEIQNLHSDSVHGTAAEVPNTYFRPHEHADVQLYSSAAQYPERFPPIRLEDGTLYRVHSLWDDLHEALVAAKHFICIAGWSVNPNVRLKRRKGDELDETVGELLLRKASEGVKVLIIIWDDLSNNAFGTEGLMAVSDEETYRYFSPTKVAIAKISRYDNTTFQRTVMSKTFTHHQKTIVVDQSDESGRIVDLWAFVGGVDITIGRYDNSEKTLFSEFDSTYKDDFYNRCLKSADETTGPRQPWQDIHSRVNGRTAVDVLRNFIERWLKQAGNLDSARSMCRGGVQSVKNGYILKELFGIIKGTMARSAIPKSRLKEINEGIKDKLDEIKDKIHTSRHRQPSQSETRARQRSKSSSFSSSDAGPEYIGNGTFTMQVVRSIDSFSAKMDHSITHPRLIDSGRKIDDSIHKAYVHHIRRAKHFVYIENQYFLGSSHWWEKEYQHKNLSPHLIPAELTMKIIQKIKQNAEFHVYVNIPLFCEGNPSSNASQQILQWQWATIRMMYLRIGRAIEQSGVKDKTPLDYLSFLCLGNREPDQGEEGISADDVQVERRKSGVSVDTRNDKTVLGKVLRSRRHQIYVHSKLLIVDDEIVLVGSANINQRSQAGLRDTEIAVVGFEPRHIASNNATPKGIVYGFRMSLWAEHLGACKEKYVNSTQNDGEAPNVRGDYDPDILNHPGSKQCVAHIRNAAQRNMDLFYSEEQVEMNGHLMLYPIKVNEMGEVSTLEGQDVIPDFGAPIAGGFASNLPLWLTS